MTLCSSTLVGRWMSTSRSSWQIFSKYLVFPWALSSLHTHTATITSFLQANKKGSLQGNKAPMIRLHVSGKESDKSPTSPQHLSSIHKHNIISQLDHHKVGLSQRQKPTDKGCHGLQIDLLNQSHLWPWSPSQHHPMLLCFQYWSMNLFQSQS